MYGSAASSILFCAIMLMVLIVALGLTLMWAEFKSKGKQNEYDRYISHDLSKVPLFPSWHVKSEESLPHWAYSHTAPQY